MKIYALCLTLMLTEMQAMAQQKMTLKQCIDYSLNNHLSNDVYENNKEIAEQQGREAASYYLPQVAATATFDYNIKRQTTIIPAGSFGPGSAEQKVQFGQPFLVNPVIQADQVIYDQSLLYGIKANTPNKALADLKFKQNQETLIYNTIAAYVEVVIYSEKERILLENENKYNDLLAIKKLQFEKGVATQLDYNRILVSYKNIVAEKTLAQTNRELATNKLKDAMGMSLKETVTFNDSINYENLIPNPDPNQFDVTQLFAYKINAQNIQLKEIDVKRKKAAYMPVLNGFVRYGAQAYSATFNDAFNQWFDYSTLGLRMTIPVFNGFRRESQLAQSKLTLSNEKQNFIINNNTLELQYLNANTQLKKSYNDVTNNKENLALAQEVFDITNFQYQKGIGTVTDVVNAEYSLKEAQNNYITSMLYLLTSTLNNEKAKGTLTSFAEKL